jgi:hypothetical protein
MFLEIYTNILSKYSFVWKYILISGVNTHFFWKYILISGVNTHFFVIYTNIWSKYSFVWKYILISGVNTHFSQSCVHQSSESFFAVDLKSLVIIHYQ